MCCENEEEKNRVIRNKGQKGFLSTFFPQKKVAGQGQSPCVVWSRAPYRRSRPGGEQRKKTAPHFEPQHPFRNEHCSPPKCRKQEPCRRQATLLRRPPQAAMSRCRTARPCPRSGGQPVKVGNSGGLTFKGTLSLSYGMPRHSASSCRKGGRCLRHSPCLRWRAANIFVPYGALRLKVYSVSLLCSPPKSAPPMWGQPHTLLGSAQTRKLFLRKKV